MRPVNRGDVINVYICADLSHDGRVCIVFLGDLRWPQRMLLGQLPALLQGAPVLEHEVSRLLERLFNRRVHLGLGNSKDSSPSPNPGPYIG